MNNLELTNEQQFVDIIEGETYFGLQSQLIEKRETNSKKNICNREKNYDRRN